MKNLISVFLIIFALFSNLEGKEARGMVNLLNLIPGKIPCKISLNGTDMLPGGMKTGAETGWFSLPAGPTNMVIECGTLKKASETLELKDAVGNVIAIYLQPDVRYKPDGTPFPPKIKIKIFPTFEAGTSSLTIVSLCPTEKSFVVGGIRMPLKPLQPVRAKAWNGEAFEIATNGKIIGRIKKSSDPANYYVFIAPGNDGSFSAAKVNADQLSNR